MYSILSTKQSKDYELLDSGDGEKLERYGTVLLFRPDPQALWKKQLPDSEWKKADAWFRRDSKDANWSIKKSMPERWAIELGGVKFWIKLSAFKHTGIFPEQLQNWEWIQSVILSQSEGSKRPDSSVVPNDAGLPQNDRKKIKILNLFGYTGGATLAAAKAGAEVVHVDGSKVAMNWARDNAALSGLADEPIRWILDDARKFVKREIKRGRKYDGIVMDPPAFGHGPAGELWKIEEHFLELLDLCRQVLSDQPLFVIINGYASGYSAIAYENTLREMMKDYGGNVEIGELTIEESRSSRLLPAGIFARWCAG